VAVGPGHDGARSALGPALRELRRRFREGSARIPASDWRAWRRTVAAGVAFMVVLMIALKTVAERLVASGTLDWEISFLRRLGDSGPFGFSTAVFFQTFGTDITLVILLTATIALAVWNRRPITALSILLAALVTDLVGRFGWAIWDRARPDVLYDGIASPGFHSFPSGHTSKTTAVYALLVFLWLRRSRSPLEWLLGLAVLLFILTVVPLGRMAMGVHWPSDVIGGFVIGAAWMAILAWALRFERTGNHNESFHRGGRGAR